MSVLLKREQAVVLSLSLSLSLSLHRPRRPLRSVQVER